MGKRIRLFNGEYYFSNRKGAIKICEGSFAQNSLGEWFLKQVMEVAAAALHAENPHSKIGINPGDDGDFLFIEPPYDKDISLSTGEKLLYGFYRQAEAKLADLPRRGHKKQAKYLDDDSKNKRLNRQHQDTTGLIREHGEFYIGGNSRPYCTTRAIGLAERLCWFF